MRANRGFPARTIGGRGDAFYTEYPQRRAELLAQMTASTGRAFRSPWLTGAIVISIFLFGRVTATLAGMEPSGIVGSLTATIYAVIGVWVLPRLVAAWTLPDEVA